MSEAKDRLARDLAEVDRFLAGLSPPRIRPSSLRRIRSVLLGEVAARGSEEILTVEETARLLRVPVRDLVEKAGEMPFFDIGGRLRIRRERLLEWIREREKEFARTSAESLVRQAVHRVA